MKFRPDRARRRRRGLEVWRHVWRWSGGTGGAQRRRRSAGTAALWLRRWTVVTGEGLRWRRSEGTRAEGREAGSVLPPQASLRVGSTLMRGVPAAGAACGLQAGAGIASPRWAAQASPTCTTSRARAQLPTRTPPQRQWLGNVVIPWRTPTEARRLNILDSLLAQELQMIRGTSFCSSFVIIMLVAAPLLSCYWVLWEALMRTLFSGKPFYVSG